MIWEKFSSKKDSDKDKKESEEKAEKKGLVGGIDKTTADVSSEPAPLKKSELVEELEPPKPETKMEVKLKELFRSEKPIAESGGMLRKIECLRPWNNYTIYTREDNDTITILDENDKELEGFLPLGHRKIFFDWRDFRNALGPNYTHIVKDEFMMQYAKDRVYQLSLVPSSVIRSLAKVEMGKENLFNLSRRSEYDCFHFEVVSDGKYVLFDNKQGAFFAFLTQNEAGVVLPPRDWMRIDERYKGQIPAELDRLAENLSLSVEGLQSINEKYMALVTDIGISIVNKDNPKGSPMFLDKIPSIGKNFVVDPINPDAVYYCQTNNPRSIVQLNLSGDPASWSPIAAQLPQKYEIINDLKLDPSGNFFLFYSKEDLVIITKEGLEEVKRMPGLTHVNFDNQGQIRAVDKDGHLVMYETNFVELAQELDKRRVAKLAEGISLQDIFSQEVSRKDQKSAEALEHLAPLREKYQAQFSEVLDKITTQEGIGQIRQGFNKLGESLRQQGLKPNEVAFIVAGLEAPILEKEKEFAAKGAKEALSLVQAQLAGGISIVSVQEARVALEAVKASEALLPEDLRREFSKASQELEQKSLELFRQRGGEIIKDVRGLLDRTKSDLEAFASKIQMDDWLEFRYPQLKARLGSLAHDCPLEADEAYKAIAGARAQLQELASQFEEKFKREYAKVREKAAERMEAAVGSLESDIDGLIDRLRSKGFGERRAAEQYLDSSEARKTLETEIAVLAGNNPDVAKELERALKVRISNVLTEIERGGMTKVAETGQQMILFGKTYFPKWEAKVREKEERKVDLVFNEDAKTHGPGVKAGQILGDIALNIKTSAGKADNVRLYEGWRDENEWRLGLLSYRGEAIAPSYMTAAEYKAVKKNYADWSQGEKSKLQKELKEKRDVLKEIYARRQKIGERTAENDEAWKQEYQKKLDEYASFIAQHQILLLKRIDKVKAEPEIEYTNGRGFVPEWQSHWVNDPETEKDLEEIAKAFKMQIDLQEGILNLKGHAGTGKDVRVKMFCHLTNRPYFATDCSKWTTEFELSEDVMLESKEGASQTVKVPSAVLNGITTPGALVYFNEFNAMPEQAQIFLHALMDEKRSLTLKTSSGKVIRALPSVLLASSMNPGYPETFSPQFATRSRMVSLEVGYPPLTRQPEPGDANQNPLYDASEALRIARGVDSLSPLTYEASLERNEFVKMWDKYINGVENGAPDPAGTQKFDIDATLALVQFANNLRENFIKIFEKSRDARNALPVTQPITGRELRRCAYDLSKIAPEEKATANPEAAARDLLEKYFLTHIDKSEDRDKILTAMNTWASKKRVRT